MIDQSKWKWFGFSAHLCVGHWCRFHMATEIGSYLISTVGAYVPPSAGSNEEEESRWLEKNHPGHEIGCDRTFETMVFKIVKGSRCTAKECGCDIPQIELSELDFEGYNTPGAATKGHRAMCKKWASKQGKKTEKKGSTRCGKK
jgi:hypothetical protein